MRNETKHFREPAGTAKQPPAATFCPWRRHRQRSALQWRVLAFPQATCLPLLAIGLSIALFPFSAYLKLAAAAPGPFYEVREVKPNVFVWVPDDILDQEADPQFRRAGTAGFIITPEAVVVINAANSPFHARDLLYEIRQRTDRPVKYVVDTDSDGEHTLGNEVFVDGQAVILSTAAVQVTIRNYRDELRQRLRGDWRLQTRMRGFHPTPPGETFEGEMVLRLGTELSPVTPGRPGPGSAGGAPAALPAEEIKLIQLDRMPRTGRPLSSPATKVAARNAGSSPAGAEAQGSDSTGDLAVYLPGSKVLFLGDLFQNGYYPRFGARPHLRDVGRWIETVRQVESWNVDVYVPGHGPPCARKELSDFRRFLEWLMNEVSTRVKEGKGLDRVQEELKTPLAAYHWHAPELAAGAVEAVYDQMAKAH